MINNTDSIYSRPIPIQYPKVGEKPSSVSVGLIDLKTEQKTWIPFDGDPRSYYIPGVQWVNDDLLLIQQLNRHQNELTVWSYVPSEMKLKKVYVEQEETFVDLMYPDMSTDFWAGNDLILADDGAAFLRMTETDAWRHIYKVDIDDGEKLLVTPFDYDVASMRVPTKNNIYYVASPENSTQRYLYQTDLKGKGKAKRLTPDQFEGVNNYQVSPNGKYALHTHQSTQEPTTVRIISLPDHKTIRTLVENQAYKEKLSALELPQVRFMKITTEDNIEVDARLILPANFDPGTKYPVLFHVYGEPWAQVATDTEIGLWNMMMAQKGYVIIDMDNRGTPCLKGSAWRKSIYRQVGRINTRDQGLAAQEILKLPFLDESRTAVWGWSGGGSMTLNLMFQFPEIYTTGVAIAAVSDQRVYDNIYQERYMGLPQENPEDFIAGSPITHAKNLEGNLLLIHGTADDNVHYQSAELLINELIAQDKQFQMMSYPNRSHSISEGENTRKHLFTLITDYILEHVPVESTE
jgi:dipeptidyl-peptidase-4